MKRSGAAALLVAALFVLLAPVAAAVEGSPTGASPVGGMGGGPYIGDVPKP
ncbi:hypothetical protein [Amycolatopsis sp. cmx-4-83]|uniref:hypothetical protein n=1 Tax=Amycolatopsis sp. cmx-4-83 TaxID=2790940 RepID=UPI00397AB6E3